MGTATSGRPVPADTAFAVSIALPPPTPTSPSAAAAASCAASTTSSGACRRTPVKRLPTGSSSSAKRVLVTRSAFPIPSSASSGSSSSSPQRTITPRAAVVRMRRTRPRPASGHAPWRDASEISRVASRPSTRASARRPAARSDSTAVREMKVTPYPASTARRTDSCRPSSSRTSRSRSLTPCRRSASSTICRTPAPSCMRIRVSSRSSSRLTVRLANRCPAGHARMTWSEKKGSKRTPRCRRAAPTMPSSSSRAATRSTTEWVSETVRKTRTSGFSRWNSHEHHGDGDRRRPRRGAEDEIAGERSFARRADLRDELILEREHALRPAVEPPPGLRGLDASARAVEQLRAEALLERADLERHRRLRDAETLGRLREAPPLDDRAERGKLARVHKRMLSVRFRTSRARRASARAADPSARGRRA